MTLDAGVTLVAGLEEASGRTAVVCGKPSAECFVRSAELVGSSPERTAMAGDDIASDVLAAQSAGLTGVLVKTGKFRPDDLSRGRPDHVIDSVAELPALMARLRA
jgi:ribonucleotide monophosphatase NagD (HAD superfamily)